MSICQRLGNLMLSACTPYQWPPGLIDLKKFFIFNAVQYCEFSRQDCRRSTDYERALQVGRQTKAGCNPFTIQIADLDFLQTTATSEKDLGCEKAVAKRPSFPCTCHRYTCAELLNNSRWGKNLHLTLVKCPDMCLQVCRFTCQYVRLDVRSMNVSSGLRRSSMWAVT